MIAAVEAARRTATRSAASSTCAVRGCPPGWGEPVFDRLEADLAKAMMSLPASKGFEIGSGFAGTELTGSEHNDEFYMEGDRVRTRTNRCGGVQGGITNGETIYFRVAFKPTATIMREQHTVDRDGDHHHGRSPAATIRASCRARCRWSKRWRRWCWPTTRSGMRRWPAARQRPCSVRHRMPHRDDVVLAALSGLFRLDRASLNSPRALLSFAEPGGAGG